MRGVDHVAGMGAGAAPHSPGSQIVSLVVGVMAMFHQLHSRAVSLILP